MLGGATVCAQVESWQSREGAEGVKEAPRGAAEYSLR